MTLFKSEIRWQVEEYLNLAPLSLRVLAANWRPTTLLEETVHFGNHPWQYCVLCRPAQVATSAYPLVFFLHGGGWRLGHPLDFRFVGRFFAWLGYPTVLGGYRLAPRYRFPAQLEDAQSGLQAGLAAARGRGWPAQRVILAGQSAGAQLVSLLAYGQPKLALDGQPAGLLLISGPLDFNLCRSREIQRYLRDYLDEPSAWDTANPIAHVRGDETIPVLCIHGEQDPTVALQNSLVFADKFNRQQPSPAQVYVVRGGHHSDIARLFLDNLAATKVIVNWLKERAESTG